MRVAMLNLTAGGLSGGYRKYLRRVVPMLREQPGISELIIAVPPGHEQTPGVGAGAWTWNSNEHWRGYPSLRDRVRDWKPDVVFIPTARYIDCNAPTLCMVQNMLPMLPPTFRDGFTAWAKLRLDATLARRATDSATRIIAVSNYVRDYLVANWNAKAENVGVVYHGVDAAAKVARPSSLRALPDQFLFTAGSLFPYRGLEDAVRALALSQHKSLSLVIAGEGSSHYRGKIEALAQQLGLTNRVIWLGQVDPTAIMYVYQECAAFLMTSRVEACPNIALEAMASGARCISTTCDPMPEFFGAPALYYDPEDAQTLAAHIDTVMTTPKDLNAQIQRDSQALAAAFTWEDTVHGVLRELRATAGQSR